MSMTAKSCAALGPVTNLGLLHWRSDWTLADFGLMITVICGWTPKSCPSEPDRGPPHNQSLNLTGAAFRFRAACRRCSGPGKLACAFGSAEGFGNIDFSLVWVPGPFLLFRSSLQQLSKTRKEDSNQKRGQASILTVYFEMLLIDV